MTISLTKTMSGTFKPSFDTDHELAKKIKVGEPYEYKSSKVRNYQFLKKFFALINLVFQNQERYKNREHLRKDLLIEAGFYEEYTDLHGTLKQEAKSISFSSMDEDEFNEVYDKVLDQICIHFKFEREDVIQNIAEFF